MRLSSSAWARVSIPILVALSTLGLLPGVALAVDARPGEVITVGPNETINDDLYAFGRTVDVLGTVRGDVIAGAGVVTISGTVAGDVLVGAGQIRIPGEVGGSIRAAGGDVSIDGRVGEDVLVGAGSLTIGQRASVGRDVYLGTGSAVISSPVNRNIKAGVGELTISNRVGGDVDTQVGRLRLSPGASVAGQLRYTSDNDADIAQGVTIQGGTDRRYPERRQPDQPSNQAQDIFVGWLRGVVGLFVLGLLFELASPGIGARTTATVTRSPATSILTGIILFIVVPIVALVVFGLGFLVGGWWIGLIILALYGISLISSVPLAGLAIGRWLFDRLGRPRIHFAWALLLGVAILTLVGLVPIAGGLLVGLIALVAFGGLVLSMFRRQPPEAEPVTVIPEPAPEPAPV